MYNLISADVFKLRKSRTIKILFGITTISAMAMALMAYLIPQGKIDVSLTGLGFMFSDMNMISILGAVIAAIFICGDFENKSIHDAIVNGCSRGAVLGSKTTIFCYALALILLPYAVVTGIALSTGSDFNMGSVSVGFLNLLTSEAGTALSAAEVWKFIIVVLSLMIVYVAQLSICIPLAIGLKKPVLVVAIYYGFSILCGQLVGLPTLESIFAYTPYGGQYAFVTLDTGMGEIFKAISVSLIFIFAMVAITYYGFRKSEIK